MADLNAVPAGAGFWSAVGKRSQDALRSGALQPISTRPHLVRDRGVEFVVRVSDNLLRKPAAPTAWSRPARENPFLPPEPALTVGSLPPGHVAVLNKFNVLENHVLVVTRDFIHQESPLTPADFAAVAAGLAGGTGLAFYNGGRTAGASQPHKHFQLVPLPIGRSIGVPVSVLLEAAENGIDTVPDLGFRHAFTFLEADPGAPEAFGRACHAFYAEALAALALRREPDGGEARLPPYNLLLTDRWLFLAPRRAEHYLDISVNGLGYAGSLFVSSAERLARVRSAGPMSILERVSIPRG